MNYVPLASDFFIVFFSLCLLTYCISALCIHLQIKIIINKYNTNACLLQMHAFVMHVQLKTQQFEECFILIIEHYRIALDTASVLCQVKKCAGYRS
jgi:hypothetical protein